MYASPDTSGQLVGKLVLQTIFKSAAPNEAVGWMERKLDCDKMSITHCITHRSIYYKRTMDFSITY